MNLSSASIIEFSEFQKEALSLRSREVKKLLEKLDAEQLAKFSMEAKEKLAELKRSDANFKDTKFNDSKEISDQRYLIEVLNTRQFDLLAKEFYAADKAVDSTTKLKGEELIAATANRDAINQRLAEMGQLRNADRLESGFTNQTSQTSVMTQVLDQIKSGARDEASQDIVSDVDLQSILKDETKQLEILIANPASNQDEVASRQDTIDQLRHFVDKRAALNDLNLPVILPVLGSSFEPHPDDKKIDLLKSNLASAAMEGRDTPDYKKAATELHEARRSYEGNDPAIRLQCSLIKDRELRFESKKLESMNIADAKLTGADSFRNEVQIISMSTQRQDIRKSIETLATHPNARLQDQNRIESAATEIRENQIEVQALEAQMSSLEPASSGRDFEPHPDDERVKNAKAEFGGVPGGVHNSTVYYKALKDLHVARREYAGNNPGMQLDASFLREAHFKYEQGRLESRLYSDRVSRSGSVGEVQRLNESLDEIKSKREANLDAIDSLIAERDLKEQIKQEQQEAKLAEATANNKAPEAKMAQASSDAAVEKAATQKSAEAKPFKASERPSFDAKVQDARKASRTKNEQANHDQANGVNGTTSSKPSPYPSSSDRARNKTPAAALDADAKQTPSQAPSKLPSQAPQTPEPQTPDRPSKAPEVGQSERPSFDTKVQEAREGARAKNEQANLAAGVASASPSQTDAERAHKLSEAVEANAQKREQPKVEAQQQDLSKLFEQTNWN